MDEEEEERKEWDGWRRKMRLMRSGKVRGRGVGAGEEWDDWRRLRVGGGRGKGGEGKRR